MATNVKRTLTSILAAILAIQLSCICLPIGGPFALRTANAEPTDTADDTLVVVSLGDSYSSGEGVEPFYNQDERQNSQDWLAHRSEHSWPGCLVFDVNGEQVQLRDHHTYVGDGSTDNVKWYFYASSGAEAKHILNESQTKAVTMKKADAWLETEDIVYPVQKPQIEYLKKAAQENGGSVDYVTLSIGGNDMGFGTILMKCATGGIGNYDGLYDALQNSINNFPNIKENLLKTYRAIADAAGPDARIIVVGYPLLLDSSGNKNIEKLAFESDEIAAINTATRWFNTQIQSLVTQMNVEMGGNGAAFYFVSVESNFSGHAALSSKEFIVGAKLGMNTQDLQPLSGVTAASFHPNWCGHDYTDNKTVDCGIHAYANAVQNLIDTFQAADAMGIASNPSTSTITNERDIVLVLDVSGSMSGNISNLKTAVRMFCETAFEKDNRVGLVTFSSDADVLCSLTSDKDTIATAAEGISSWGNTNMDAGLQQAESMLASSTAEKKIIILMSDGEANNGRVGEDLVKYAQQLKNEGITIYTLGFFGSAGGGNSTEQQLMEAIATDRGFHYEVTNADSLVFIFGDIADQLNGVQFMYVRIACPVDVTVSYGGETLSSATSTESQRTSFGTLTFEDQETSSNGWGSNSSSGDLVKILRLREGQDYEVNIRGTGAGSMTCTIGFTDGEGNYADYRTFENLSVTSSMSAQTTIERSDYTLLKIDNDGDGSYESTYRANANEYGYKVNNSAIVYLTLGFCGFLSIAVVALIVIVRTKKRAGAEE